MLYEGHGTWYRNLRQRNKLGGKEMIFGKGNEWGAGSSNFEDSY
jgi:hypothetical protein